jgi:hypothetical protein
LNIGLRGKKLTAVVPPGRRLCSVQQTIHPRAVRAAPSALVPGLDFLLARFQRVKSVQFIEVPFLAASWKFFEFLSKLARETMNIRL